MWVLLRWEDVVSRGWPLLLARVSCGQPPRCGGRSVATLCAAHSVRSAGEGVDWDVTETGVVAWPSAWMRLHLRVAAGGFCTFAAEREAFGLQIYTP